jgi:putative transposase
MIRGGAYHVMNRGNRKCIIFRDNIDRRRFTRILVEVTAEFGVETAVEMQMGTHFHLIVVTPHGNISAFMQALEGQFATYFNWRHHEVGHLFQGPFKSVVIENDIHLFTTVWYIFNNPVEAGIVGHFEDWQWGTYAATAGLAAKQEHMSISWLPALFPTETLETSQRLFRQCMEDPDPIDAYLFLVDPASAGSISSYVHERLKQMGEPLSYRELFRPPLDLLYPRDQGIPERNAAIVIGHRVHGYKLAEIARATGLDPSTVGRIFRRFRSCIGFDTVTGSDPE